MPEGVKTFTKSIHDKKWNSIVLIQNTIDFSGVSGKVYRFDVYPKSASLPNKGGVYILTYSHPRGHLAGFQVNVLRIDTAINLNSTIAHLQQDDSLLKACWNYTCAICLDDPIKRHEYIEDLSHNTSIQC